MRKSSGERKALIGKILFSERRITIEQGNDSYYVHPRGASGFLHGDIVEFSESRVSKDRKLAEARPERLVKRTEEEILIQATLTKKGIRWSLLPIFGKLSIEVNSNPKVEDEDLFIGKFETNKKVRIIRRFGNLKDAHVHEELIFFRAGVRTKWPKNIEEIEVKSPEIQEYQISTPSFGASRRIQASGNLDPSFHRGGQSPETSFGTSLLPQSLSLKENIFPKVRVNGQDRLDFRSWYTMTIDGADAKDLDDAISIATYEGGDTLLGVHIADVAEYVKEDSPIDREGFLRGTSIYTPGRVIPMLPEILSNNLCSLHPGEPKLTLSILIRIDKKGYVKETFVTEGVIESRHRGVYEEIGNLMNDRCIVPSFGTKGRIQKNKNINPSLHSGGQAEIPVEILTQFSRLYTLLRDRRKKEGKIIFDTTECYFNMDDNGNIIDIRKRERGDAHMMIEEFMVLANEEVAKWCIKRNIPFLSRVHDAPSVEKTREIFDVLLANKEYLTEEILTQNGEEIEPHHIRSILEHAKSDVELSYRLSRLLLPKMAKAVYKEKPVRHFGLALSHYAHFTSPIRRYPDLLLHRMIKYHLSKVSKFDKKTYDRQMKQWGESLSLKERNAEDVSRAVDDVAMCRYMSKYVGKTYSGRISGVTESNVYVELENGVEGSIYLAQPSRFKNNEGGGLDSREKLTLDLARGSLRNPDGKELYQIGKKIAVKILSVDIDARRIEMGNVRANLAY